MASRPARRSDRAAGWRRAPARRTFAGGPAVAGAQAPTPPSAPSARHEPLAFLEGLWTVEGLPAAREFRERCTWMEGGRRHVVCRSRSRSAAGDLREGISIFSYRPADSTYLYHGFRSSGAVETMEGRATAVGWEFHAGSGAGASRERARVTIVRRPDGNFLLLAATATGDAPFGAADTTRYRRLPDAPPASPD